MFKYGKAPYKEEIHHNRLRHYHKIDHLVLNSNNNY